MQIALIGAAGGVGRRFGAQAVAAGHQVSGLVRTQEQADMLQLHGVEAVLGDLAGQWESVLDGADAVVWAAGAGAGGDVQAIDGDALVRLTDTLKAHGPRRLVVVSSMGVGRAEQMPPYLQGILKVKALSDAHIQQSGLDWTIVRPGALKDDLGTGTVEVAATLPGGSIPRDDVAAVLLACLNTPSTIHQTFEVVSGQQSIGTALAGL